MVVEPNDWRLARDPEWTRGLVFRWSRWSPTPTWDHDHCEFCWQEFCDAPHDLGDGTLSLQEGYAARGPCDARPEEQRDDYYWVCPTCFEDFKELFDWTVSRSAPSG